MKRVLGNARSRTVSKKRKTRPIFFVEKDLTNTKNGEYTKTKISDDAEEIRRFLFLSKQNR